MPLTNFGQQIVAWIGKAFNEGVGDFGDLVLALPGVSPPEIAAALASMPDLPAPFSDLPAADHLIFARNNGSIPHPLDYDWRFSPRAISLLAEEALRHCPTSGTIALLGCPSLARSPEFSTRKLWLLDRNAGPEEVASHCRVTTVDLLSGAIPTFSADVAIADPPWYPEIQMAFLWAAAKVLPVGGIVLSSSPPAGSRPTAVEDHETLVACAEALGLKALAIRRAALPYLTPPFEGIAFRAAGSPAFPVDWRRGDLTVFRKCADVDTARPLCTIPETTWSEFNIEGVRIRVREAIQTGSDPGLYALVPDNVLPTVSRRDPIRGDVAVWTSGNRVFGSRNPSLVAATLERMQLASAAGPRGRPVPDSREPLRSECRSALRVTLERIVECERREYIDRGGEPRSCKPGSRNFEGTSIERS